MSEIENTCLVVVDVQGKLARVMADQEALFRNIRILIEAAKILGIPRVWMQQSPDALGPTVESIACLLEGCEPVNKVSFSCWGHEEFRRLMRQMGRREVLLCGIEAHICIYQTAVDLIRSGFIVHVAADAVSSRVSQNKETALARMATEGARVTTVEMALFELLKTAAHPAFRQIAKLVK